MTARTRRSATLLWTLFFVFSIGLQYVAALTPQTTLADVAPSVFELDGNAVTNHAGAGLPDDWDRVFNGTSSATHTVFVNDQFNSNTDNIFLGGGSKDPNDLNQWAWTGQKPQDKNDIENAYAASYVNAANGHRLVFFGLDRYATSGDGFVGFWFFKSPVATGSGGNFVDNLGNAAVHHEGDVLVQANFTIGGTISTFQVSKWHNGALTLVTSNSVDCSSNPGGGDEACGIVNAVNNIASPWSYTPKAGNANQFPTSAFFEGGLDMTTAGLDQGCFSTFMAETRSSQSLTSTLSDFALGTFSFCNPPTITTNAQLNGQNLSTASSIGSISLGQSVTDHATFSGSNGTVTGTVQFSVCGPNASAPDCSSGGTAVGSPVTITGGSPSTANSPPFTPTAAGYYCFRADYTPDTASSNKYLPGSETNTNTECFRVLAPNLSITKTADAPSVSAGDPIGFTITVSNNSAAGTGTASNVTLSDPLPTGSGISWSIAGGTGASDCSITSGTLNCSFGSMAPGASFTVHVTSPTDKTSCATYPNTATAQASNNAAVQASASTTVNCASVAIVKTPDQGTVSAGDQIGFTVTVTNNGLGTASGVTVDDPLPTTAGTSWTIDAANSSPGWSINGSGHLVYGPATLASKASVHVHITSGTTAASCGVVSNTASVATSNDGSGSSTATVTVNCPKLSIVKTADAATVSAGDPIGFTVTVSNSAAAGTGTAHAVTLSDPLPAGVTWTISPAYSGPGSCSITSGTLNCAFGDMAPGASVSVHVTALTSAAACSVYNNTATASATNAPSIQASATVTCRAPDVTIVKTADAGPFSAGDTIGFTVTVSNIGAGTATGVTATDTLPTTPGTSWSITTPVAGWSLSGGVLTFGGPTTSLAPGGTSSVHIQSSTTSASCGTVSNTGLVSAANEPASNTGNNSSTASLVVNCGDVTVTKSADATPVQAGDQIGFTITVSNIGLGIARNVTVTDPLPTTAGLSWSISGPANGFSISGGNLTWGPTDLAPGASVSVHIVSSTTRASCTTIPNTVNVTTTNDGNPTANASVTVLCPFMSITKANNTDGPVQPGASVEYTLTLHVTNPPVPSATIVDQLPTGIGSASAISDGGTYNASTNQITWNLTNVADGKTLTYTAVVSASAAAGSYTNVATITDGPCVESGCSSTSTVVVQVMSISKANNTTGPVAPGTAVNYTLTLHVTNGPVPTATVVDQLPTGIGNATNISDAGAYDSTANTITWHLSDVSDGDTLTYTAVVSTTAATGSYVNTATITSGPCQGSGCSATSTVVVPALTLTKSVVDDTANNGTTTVNGVTVPLVKVGDTLTYTLTYTLANGPVHNAVITDVMPTGVDYVTGSASNGGTYDAGSRTLTWSLGTLTAGGTVTYKATVPTGADKLTQPLTNVATIQSTETAPVSAHAAVYVVFQQVFAATGTPPATSTVPVSSNGTGGLNLAVVVLGLAMLMTVIGLLTPMPERARRRSSRR